MLANLQNYFSQDKYSAIFFIVLVFVLLFCITYFIITIYKHYKYLNSDDVEIDENYNSVKFFFATLDHILKVYLRRVAKIYKVYSHYMYLIILKGIDKIQLIMDWIYDKIRGRFVRKSVADKSLVVHFWDHLKNYKREIDKEKEEGK